jgi:hypothetical protein
LLFEIKNIWLLKYELVYKLKCFFYQIKETINSNIDNNNNNNNNNKNGELENDRKKKLNYYKQLFTILFRRQQLSMFSGLLSYLPEKSRFSLYANIEINNKIKNQNLKTWLSQNDLTDANNNVINDQKKIRSSNSETRDVMIVVRKKPVVSRFKFSELLFRLFDFNYF